MCGIFGVGGGRSSRIDKEYVSDLLAHRGPNGYNTYSTGNIFLAHSRLSIIDVAGGSQPMTNEDQSLIITYNGEIYNYRELRQELEQKGLTFRTSSDTEVLLQTYGLISGYALSTSQRILPPHFQSGSGSACHS